MNIRVFNYNTHEKVIGFEAHADYIRSIAVHPTQPYVLSSSDDFTIKLWDWEHAWKNIMVYFYSIILMIIIILILVLL